MFATRVARAVRQTGRSSLKPHFVSCPMEPPTVAEGVSAALRRAVAEGVFQEVPESPEALAAVAADLAAGGDGALLRKPVGLFYDMGSWEGNLLRCKAAFGEGFFHAMALKSNGVTPMVKRAHKLGFGAEAASIGEVRHAEYCGFKADEVIFDSPVKTATEIAYALTHNVHLNIDNTQELERIVEVRKGVQSSSDIGMRINPLVGAGEIAALSVSVPTSKFGTPIDRREEIFAAYRKYPWLNAIHVHAGSYMGSSQLVAGIKKVVTLALEINKDVGRDQICVFDMGGGLPVNYTSEPWHNDHIPSFEEYAKDLRAGVPQLFPGSPGCPFRRVITEFGQSLNAKAGWLASRIEYAKSLQSGEGEIVMIHFGADVCPRQVYSKDHNRRIEFYDGRTMRIKEESEDCPITSVHVAGPLCFEGDHLAKGLQTPRLSCGDVVVLREAGANTMSLFSRHCQRQVPPVYGYRVQQGSDGGWEVTEWETLKPTEDLQGSSRHWGLDP